MIFFLVIPLFINTMDCEGQIFKILDKSSIVSSNSYPTTIKFEELFQPNFFHLNAIENNLLQQYILIVE